MNNPLPPKTKPLAKVYYRRRVYAWQKVQLDELLSFHKTGVRPLWMTPDKRWQGKQSEDLGLKSVNISSKVAADGKPLYYDRWNL